MRSSIGGWVASQPLSGSSAGLSMKKACMREGMAGIVALAEILRSAEIIASGFLVSSTEPASASNSRERDSASRTSTRRHAQRDHRHRDHYDEDGAAAGRGPRANVAAAARRRRENPAAKEELGGEAENAGEDHRDHHHLGVAIADMGQLVAEHRLDLLVGQMGEQARVTDMR